MNWDTIINMTLASMKARYRKTFAGLIWVCLNPIIVFSVQSIVFKFYLKIDIPDYYIFLMGGLLPWILLTSSIEMGVGKLFMSRELLLSFNLHPKLLIYSQVFDNALNFVISFIVLLIPFSFMGKIGPSVFLLPLSITLLFFGVLNLVWFLSVLNIFFRDTRFISTFVTSIFFFLTPIFYPIDYIPEDFRFIATLNPFYVLIMPVRACIYDFSWAGYMDAFGKASVLVGLLYCMAYFYWKKKRNEFYSYL